MADDAIINLQVFAIEMVYVPGGVSFNVGGAGGTSAFTSTSITTATANISGGFPTGQTAPNASWPNGYNAFYCMKYEISQGQYRDFLNTLTYSQQATRTATAPNNDAGTGALSSTNANRNGIDIQTPGIESTTPAVYACNLDGDASYNETTDGEWIACNFLSWDDGAAYLDWAGLRPMTEMEYEKAGRGAASFVNGEFAWGNNVIANSSNSSTANYTITDGSAGASNETINSNYVTTGGNALYAFTESSILGPARVGIFAANTSNFSRETSGASYYGIMELSGNLWERTVTTGSTTEGGIPISNSNARRYNGTHGNGSLSSTGDADASSWPVFSTTQSIFWPGRRGGSWSDTQPQLSLRTSIANNIFSGRFNDEGFRGVRTAPN